MTYTPAIEHLKLAATNLRRAADTGGERNREIEALAAATENLIGWLTSPEAEAPHEQPPEVRTVYCQKCKVSLTAAEAAEAQWLKVGSYVPADPGRAFKTVMLGNFCSIDCMVECRLKLPKPKVVKDDDD